MAGAAPLVTAESTGHLASGKEIDLAPAVIWYSDMAWIKLNFAGFLNVGFSKTNFPPLFICGIGIAPFSLYASDTEQRQGKIHKQQGQPLPQPLPCDHGVGKPGLVRHNEQHEEYQRQEKARQRTQGKAGLPAFEIKQCNDQRSEGQPRKPNTDPKP